MSPPPATTHPLLQRMTACVDAARAWRVILALLVVTVAWLALTPVPPEHLSTGWDKADHALAFAALGWASVLSFPHSRRAHLAMPCAALVFGAAIEGLQQFVPGRSPQWVDLFADAIGVACGAGLAGLALLAATRKR